MKEFICKECGKVFSTQRGLNQHISSMYGSREYYNKWLKSELDGICKNCGEETKFYKLSYGYMDTCSKKCADIFAHKKSVDAIQLKYGVDNPQKNKRIKDKTSRTNLKRYGNICPMQNKLISKKIKELFIKKYGVEYILSNKDVYNKGFKTKKEIYGDKNYNNRTKAKQTCLDKYDCENPSQYKEFQDKKIKNSIGKFSTIKYQGSYELDFLKKYLKKFPDIIRASSIKYKFKEKNRVYHPDFYIPSLNLIIEIKNSYLYKRDKEIIHAKEKATISNGFEYILIIDKDYSLFESILPPILSQRQD